MSLILQPSSRDFRLFLSGQFSDLTIICGDSTYRVHKAFLCPQSHFFDSACNGRFAVSHTNGWSTGDLIDIFKESKTGQIDLSDEDPVAVEHMVHYFYHLDYVFGEFGHFVEDLPTVFQAPKTPKPTKTKPKKLDLSKVEDPLVGIANDTGVSPPSPTIPSPTPSIDMKFERPPLPKRKPNSRRQSPRHEQNSWISDSDLLELDQEISKHAQQNGFVEHEDHQEYEELELVIHARVYALAEKFGISGLKALAKKKFELLIASSVDDLIDAGFVDALEEVYTTTVDSDRGLRNVVVHAFRKEPMLAYQADVRQEIPEIPPLAFDLYRVNNGIPVRG